MQKLYGEQIFFPCDFKMYFQGNKSILSFYHVEGRQCKVLCMHFLNLHHFVSLVILPIHNSQSFLLFKNYGNKGPIGSQLAFQSFSIANSM